MRLELVEAWPTDNPTRRRARFEGCRWSEALSWDSWPVAVPECWPDPALLLLSAWSGDRHQPDTAGPYTRYQNMTERPGDDMPHLIPGWAPMTQMPWDNPMFTEGVTKEEAVRMRDWHMKRLQSLYRTQEERPG